MAADTIVANPQYSPKVLTSPTMDSETPSSAIEAARMATDTRPTDMSHFDLSRPLDRRRRPTTIQFTMPAAVIPSIPHVTTVWLNVWEGGLSASAATATPMSAPRLAWGRQRRLRGRIRAAWACAVALAIPHATVYPHPVALVGATAAAAAIAGSATIAVLHIRSYQSFNTAFTLRTCCTTLPRTRSCRPTGS
jgi:hypothetical protein